MTDRHLAGGLALTTLALRLAFWAAAPTEWDSVQLTLGARDFDVTAAAPHPPGYWLYARTGWLLASATPLDHHGALALLAAVASAATVSVAYLVGLRLGGRWLAVAIAVFLATSPFAWFYGSTANSYVFEGLASALLIYLAITARPGSRHGVAAAAILGVALGFRQSALLLAPVAAVAAVKSGRSVRHLAWVAAAAIVAVAAWIVQDGHYSDEHERDRVIEVPVGGDALFILDVPSAEVAGAVAKGRLAYGATVWRVEPGAEPFGVGIRTTS